MTEIFFFNQKIHHSSSFHLIFDKFFSFFESFLIKHENHYVRIDKVFDWSIWIKNAERDKTIENIEIDAALSIIMLDVESYYKKNVWAE
jgi:hypothetical protein